MRNYKRQIAYQAEKREQTDGSSVDFPLVLQTDFIALGPIWVWAFVEEAPTSVPLVRGTLAR
jgi:hypothetical protein